VKTKHPKIDTVIIRENEEDLYAGIEHQQTDEVVQCLKLISRPGCEKIVRYAFEFARRYHRRKVTCLTKDNIMKQTDGLFHQVFREIAAEYPEIQSEHRIVDIGSAMLADTPEVFDVIVLPNLYGDVLSDIAAQIAGSVGLAGSANIGEQCAMFEAIHGSAPDIAGKNIANPSGLIQAAVMLLSHIGQGQVAEAIQNAWLKTIEDGIHTFDVYQEGLSTARVGTREFADAVIANLGQRPHTLQPVSYGEGGAFKLPGYQRKSPARKELAGVDLFVHWTGTKADELAEALRKLENHHVKLTMITNRGIKVWPDGFEETFCTDHWRCRFSSADERKMDKKAIIDLLQQCERHQIDTIKTENLYYFDGKQGFSLGQGQ
ncbi:MAG: NADP-dependent isocitrate dehydrogenase, partial [Saprospiraceae bacterium]|nr:NADP-dependent isocitrate dehydrogenase [Saprospiraceae bacterium]